MDLSKLDFLIVGVVGHADGLERDVLEIGVWKSTRILGLRMPLLFGV